MTWLLVAIGVLVGAAHWGLPGAITLGFLGWLINSARPFRI